jgi:hypothetical protein
MSKLLFAVLTLALLDGKFVVASDLVQFPQGVAAWTVTISHDGSKGVAPTTPTSSPGEGVTIDKIDVEQGEKIRCSTLSFSNGDKRASWDIPGTIVIITEDTHGNPYVTYPSLFFKIPYLPSEFDWVSSSLLQETKPISYNGKECFHYKGKNEEAWIDSKTLLPVALSNGNDLATYTFLAPPVNPPVLPPKFKQKLDYYYMTQGAPQPHR